MQDNDIKVPAAASQNRTMHKTVSCLTERNRYSLHAFMSESGFSGQACRCKQSNRNSEFSYILAHGYVKLNIFNHFFKFQDFNAV